MRRWTSKRDLALLRLGQGGRCFKCHEPLEVFHIDHFLALKLGGTDTFDNKVLLCIPCHAAKTHGTGATTAGTDIGKIKKERKRLKPKLKRSWPSRPVQSRPWPK